MAQDFQPYTKKVGVLNPNADNDVLYGLYETVVEALAGVPSELREVGRKVGIVTGGTKVTTPSGYYYFVSGVVKEWVFQGGILDEHLVPYQTEFNPNETDLSEFTNTSVNPFIQQAELNEYIPLSQKAIANGVAGTDEDNFLLPEHIPDWLMGSMLLGGTIDMTTGVVTLSNKAKSKLGTTASTITLTNDTTPITGYEDNEAIFYVASNEGTLFSIECEIGDYFWSRGGGWTKTDNTDAVRTVDGGIGNVTTGYNIIEGQHQSLISLSKPRTLIVFDTIASNGTHNIPNPVSQAGKEVLIIGRTLTNYTLTVGTSGSTNKFIDKDGSIIDTMIFGTANLYLRVVSDGVYWRVLQSSLYDSTNSKADSGVKQVNSNYTLLQTDSGKTILVDGNNRVITVPSGLVGKFHITVKVRGTGCTLVDSNGLLVGKPTELTSPYTIPQYGVLYFLRDDDGNIDLTGDIL